MPENSNFPAHGKVTAVKDQAIVFHPAGTNYELHLIASSAFSGPPNKPIHGIVRVTARKVYTVPSGGNFIQPIFGSPRIIQGRVLFVDDKSMVVQAGCPILVDLPAVDSAIDLDNGQITVGMMANVVALPGARFSRIEAPAADRPVAQTVH
jgi:hypothetical protein